MKQPFNPTQEESDKIRKMMKDMGPAYENFVACYPCIKEVIDMLPGEPGEKGKKKLNFAIQRVFSEFWFIFEDALCRVRGIPDGSIKIIF